MALEALLKVSEDKHGSFSILFGFDFKMPFVKLHQLLSYGIVWSRSLSNG